MGNDTTAGRQLETALVKMGLSQTKAQLFGVRRDHSDVKLHQLSSALGRSAEVQGYPGLTIFSAGSYARGEASAFSDIDLFFVSTRSEAGGISHPKMQEMKIMASVMRITESDLHFPPASNDGEFLKILHLNENLKHLGGREDDFRNHFTARMLMILESHPVFGPGDYSLTLSEFINSYLRDYQDHSSDFRPTFIVNDIIRFWKTLCLNYEHKRNQPIDDAKKIKQKIRNFKLAFSRLMTCFSTVALLASYRSIDADELLNIMYMRPIERLISLSEKEPKVTSDLLSAIDQYHWFLDKTKDTTSDLEEYFSDRNNRTEAFSHSGKFGDAIYKVVNTAATEAGTLRYLVV